MVYYGYSYSNSNTALSTGAIIGIVIGCVGGILTLVGCIVIIIICCNKKPQQQQQQQQMQQP